MALTQLNLKVPPAVAADWRRRAAAEGLSVRDWLVRVTAMPEAPVAGSEVPVGREELQDLDRRLRALESATAGPVPPRRPAAPAPIPADLPADGIETTRLAQLLNVKRGTLNARVMRLGGPVAGLELDGWRCLGLRSPARGGPPRAVWAPIAPGT